MKLCVIITCLLMQTLVQVASAKAEPYYANGAVRAQINSATANSGRTQAVRPRPNVSPNMRVTSTPIQQPILQAQPAPAFISKLADEVVIIEAATPPAIFSKQTATSNTPHLDKPLNIALPAPLNIVLPDKRKAEYIPENYAPIAPQEIIPLINIAPVAIPVTSTQAPASQAPASQRQSSPSKYGWQQYIAPEIKRVQKAPSSFNLRPYTGYRLDNVNWNVAGPNIPKLSELTYENISMAEIGIDVDYTKKDGVLSGLHLEGKASYANAFSGRHTDSDFVNRLPIYDKDRKPTGKFADGVFEFSRTEGDSDNGSSNQFSAAIGYELWREDFDGSSFGITPIIGYSYQTMDLTMTNGEFMNPRGGVGIDGKNYDADSIPPVLDGTPFNGLNSAYNSEWKGPFAGLSVGFESGSHQIGFKGQLHHNNFSAEATWNLRAQFRQPLSFAQEGSGFGFDLGADYDYLITDSWGVFAGINYKSFGIRDGKDTVYFADGKTTSSQRLNEVSWSSQLYRFGAKYSF